MLHGDEVGGHLGRIVTKDGVVIDCRFALEHVEGSPVRIYCVQGEFSRLPMTTDCVKSVESRDTETPIRSDGWHQIFERRTSPADPEVVILAARIIEGDRTQTSQVHRLYLANLLYHAPSTPIDVPSRSIEVDVDGARVHLMLEGRADYAEQWHLLRATKGSAVTCRMTVFVPSGCSEPWLIEVIDDICTVLSLSVGYRVYWVAWECESILGDFLWREFGWRGSSPYNPTPLDLNRRPAVPPPLQFVKQCLSAYRSRKSALELRGLVNQWLDARRETDESTNLAIKMCVVIETLRSTILYRQGTEETRDLVPKEDWTRAITAVLPAVREILKQQLEKNEAAKNHLSSPQNWLSVNRRSFNTELKRAFELANIAQSSEDIRIFVAIRNKLIHEGRFLTFADPKELARLPNGPKSVLEEFWFVLSFVDRTMLQLAGYKY